MDVFLINLDRCPERYARIRDLLAPTGLDLHRVQALDGDRLRERPYPAPPRAGALPADRTVLTRYEIALILGHRRAWRHFLRTDAPFAVILEDDVYFGEGFEAFVSDPGLLDSGFDVIKLETLNDRVVVSPTAHRTIAGRGLRRLLSTHMGTAGYMVSREAARRLLVLSRGAPAGMDSIMFDFDRMKRSGLKPLRIGQVTPALIIQHDVRRDAPAQAVALGSIIGGDRGRRVGHAPPTSGKIWREVTRPFRQIWFKLRSDRIEFQ